MIGDLLTGAHGVRQIKKIMKKHDIKTGKSQDCGNSLEECLSCKLPDCCNDNRNKPWESAAMSYVHQCVDTDRRVVLIIRALKAGWSRYRIMKGQKFSDKDFNKAVAEIKKEEGVRIGGQRQNC